MEADKEGAAAASADKQEKKRAAALFELSDAEDDLAFREYQAARILSDTIIGIAARMHLNKGSKAQCISRYKAFLLGRLAQDNDTAGKQELEGGMDDKGNSAAQP